MATRIRLARYGAKKRPFYRIVVTDQRTPSGRRSLELLGTYDPRQQDLAIRLDGEKLRHWLDRGAQPSETVARLIARSGVLGGEQPSAAEPAAEAPAAADPQA